ncbi:MAG: hypothetical protein KBT04_07455 [Bacteroidales bacterium]|nr:hypothetical protein [Candidatus Colimorpha onthohippi]
MAKFEIGDKVKFLNAIGGGVVTKIAKDTVYVKDETGFDMPMAPNELIRMADQQGAATVFNQECNTSSKNESKNAPYREPTTYELEEENRRLRSQNASLQDRVRQLESQVINLQRTLARLA